MNFVSHTFVLKSQWAEFAAEISQDRGIAEKRILSLSLLFLSFFPQITTQIKNYSRTFLQRKNKTKQKTAKEKCWGFLRYEEVATKNGTFCHWGAPLSIGAAAQFQAITFIYSFQAPGRKVGMPSANIVTISADLYQLIQIKRFPAKEIII